MVEMNLVAAQMREDSFVTCSDFLAPRWPKCGAIGILQPQNLLSPCRPVSLPLLQAAIAGVRVADHPDVREGEIIQRLRRF